MNWNTVVSVTNGSNIATPSQLLPLLIGLTGLVRVTWIAVHGGLLERYEAETPERTRERPVNIALKPSQRYLVAWLPWLSRFSHFRSGPSTGEYHGVDAVDVEKPTGNPPEEG